MERIYRSLSGTEANFMIDWAEENGVDWEIWNAESVLLGYERVELWMERWPT